MAKPNRVELSIDVSALHDRPACCIDIIMYMMQLDFEVVGVISSTCKRLHGGLENMLTRWTTSSRISNNFIESRLPNGLHHGTSTYSHDNGRRTEYGYVTGVLRYIVKRRKAQTHTRGAISSITWVAPEGMFVNITHDNDDRGMYMDAITTDGHHNWSLQVSSYRNTIAATCTRDGSDDVDDHDAPDCAVDNIGDFRKWLDNVAPTARSVIPFYDVLLQNAHTPTPVVCSLYGMGDMPGIKNVHTGCGETPVNVIARTYEACRFIAWYVRSHRRPISLKPALLNNMRKWLVAVGETTAKIDDLIAVLGNARRRAG